VEIVVSHLSKIPTVSNGWILCEGGINIVCSPAIHAKVNYLFCLPNMKALSLYIFPFYISLVKLI